MTTTTYWIGERQHQPLTVLDGATPVNDYEVAVVAYPASYTDADWQPSTVYAGKRGVWIESTSNGPLEAGTYRVWARVGNGAPDERAVVLCGFVEIRGG